MEAREYLDQIKTKLCPRYSPIEFKARAAELRKQEDWLFKKKKGPRLRSALVKMMKEYDLYDLGVPGDNYIIGVRGDLTSIDQLLRETIPVRTESGIPGGWVISKGPGKNIIFYINDATKGTYGDFSRYETPEGITRTYNGKLGVHSSFIHPGWLRVTAMARGIVTLGERLLETNIPCYFPPRNADSSAFWGLYEPKL